ncbi:MAG: iron complex outermembrane receptor protein [Cyclobacteriaceae bacterium]
MTDGQELYGFTNYAERKVVGGFFFRNPNNRDGVFSDSGNRAIIDNNLVGQSGQTSNCPVTAATGLLAISTLPANCQVANTIYPGGYTPAFGGSVQDNSILGGIRGDLSNGLKYDVSYSVAVAAFASDLNVAFSAEYRV